jgi:hypothetical protein
MKEADTRSQEARRELLAMLDHNRPWLDEGPTGSGWRPTFRALSYTFHTIREDVRERCVLDRDGDLAFEVSHDGRGKMKDRLGDRTIALKSPEFAASRRGTRFAWVHARSGRERDHPYDLLLKQYARIGCQLDLPLFRYRDQLDSAAVAVEDGTWAGRPCRVATISSLPGATYLGFGTMLAFTSWSYVHHVVPGKEVFYIDKGRNVPIHERFESARDKRTFEIDFGDYVEAEPGQWAPRSIRIESKDYFTCEYRFRLVAGTHWMLEEVLSWFKPEDKSRGVVEDVQVDGNREPLDDALRQVESTRVLFGGAGEPDRRVDVATVPFVLGRAIRSGPYELRVTLAENRTVVVSATTSDPAAPGVVPLGFLDDKQRPLFAASIALEPRDGARRGSVSLGGSSAWRSVRSMAVPVGEAASTRLPVAAVPVRWGESFSVNIPCTEEADSPGDPRKPRDAQTRAWRVRLDRADGGTARLSLDLVSIDGPKEFVLDLAAVLLGESGELLACGHLSTSLRVVSQPVEQRFEVDLGRIGGASAPKYLAIGLARGDVISAPMGSRWGTYMRTVLPFDIPTLLAVPDDNCRRIGLVGLGNREQDQRIQAEFLGDRLDERMIGDGPYSRRTLLRPNAESLVRIVREAGAADTRAAAARFLAYSEAEGAAGVLGPLSDDPAPQVRDAVAIGLTFLGRPEPLDRLRSILSREAPSLEKDANAWRSFDRLEHDALIALAHQHSDAAVDLLGETLRADLEGLRPAADQRGQTQPQGHSSRARAICTLLGRTGNPRAVRWLIAAADLIDRRPDLAKNFDQDALAQSLLQFKDRAKDRIVAGLEKGDAAGVWAHAIRESSDSAFVVAIRSMLRRPDINDGAAYAGVLYLWNVDTAEAVDGLREAYDRGVLRGDRRLRLRLCEALAAKGDGRGLADAYEVLVELERPAQPPAEDRPRWDWLMAREKQQREAEAVFGRAAPEVLGSFLLPKAEVASPEERRVVLRLLWKVPDLPAPFAAVLPKWAKDADRPVAELAMRLLKRN